MFAMRPCLEFRIVVDLNDGCEDCLGEDEGVGKRDVLYDGSGGYCGAVRGSVTSSAWLSCADDDRNRRGAQLWTPHPPATAVASARSNLDPLLHNSASY